MARSKKGIFCGLACHSSPLKAATSNVEVANIMEKEFGFSPFGRFLEEGTVL
jgi:hypothetical protein